MALLRKITDKKNSIASIHWKVYNSSTAEESDSLSKRWKIGRYI